MRCAKVRGTRVQIPPPPPVSFWGHSSVGRAPALQAGGRRFEPGWLHQSPTTPVRLPAGRRCAFPPKPEEIAGADPRGRVIVAGSPRLPSRAAARRVRPVPTSRCRFPACPTPPPTNPPDGMRPTSGAPARYWPPAPISCSTSAPTSRPGSSRSPRGSRSGIRPPGSHWPCWCCWDRVWRRWFSPPTCAGPGSPPTSASAGPSSSSRCSSPEPTPPRPYSCAERTGPGCSPAHRARPPSSSPPPRLPHWASPHSAPWQCPGWSRSHGTHSCARSSTGGSATPPGS